MTTERGPILRRRRNPDEKEAPPPETHDAPATPAVETTGAYDPVQRGAATTRAPSAPNRDGGEARPTRALIGRRAYDPRSDRSPGPAPAPSGTPASTAAKKGKKFGARPSMSEEKLALRAKAQILAKEKSIPLIHAYRILKGQTTLNEVLKGMMRKERFEQMITRDGIDRELAGQVASGHLSKQRALLLTRMRTLRKQKLHVDGIKAAEIEKVRVGLDIFGIGWVAGRVRNVRPYEFDFFSETSEKSERYFKHDVKAICAAEDLDAVRAAVSTDEGVKAAGLAATEDRAERVKPDDEVLLRAIESNIIVRFTMRDGELILGRVRSFGRWDAEVCLDSGEIVTVFFHGLHALSKTLGYKA